jgi:hypothetical protein
MNTAGKRTLTLCVAGGTSVELSLWAFLYFVVNRSMWLERLQEPGMKAGEALASSVHRHFGLSAVPYLGTTAAFTVMIALWSVVVFVAFGSWRSWSQVHRLKTGGITPVTRRSQK